MERKVLTVVTVILLTFFLAAVAPQESRRNADKAAAIKDCSELLSDTSYYLNCTDCGTYNLDLSNNQIERLQLRKLNTSYTVRYYQMAA
ncbi:MAG: hypothetical protein K9M99_02505 [Candidatus Cloacimonetes bacterium]|nr:hypothetical protein [Candidatus Cloacimonadota bacterium]